CQQGYGFPFTF
nr:immunoglobulin light chain junction region [Macaca mulatta]MOV77847.1 immunoglobulin light chain junction region [Macaca mulatta]MOV78274.1 immunoglobulin light chain junction region [Macaca mulatta]MOV78296.1 immunoglobulin light chain junction region [Macaca mulatta]MOV78326.1 immunoglobulin light chain junction region [Macaca mulatta]